MTGVGKYFVLAFTALLPLLNPFGSALVFLGMIGQSRMNSTGSWLGG